jgi:hypothetical protein
MKVTTITKRRCPAVSAECDCNCGIPGDVSEMSNCTNCGLRQMRPACSKAYRQCVICQKTYKYHQTNIDKKCKRTVFATDYQRKAVDQLPSVHRPLSPPESEMITYRSIIHSLPLPLCNKTKPQVLKLLESYGGSMGLHSDISSQTHLERTLDDHATRIPNNDFICYEDLRTLRTITTVDASQVHWRLNDKVMIKLMSSVFH